jgi:hypothetical protein
MTYPPIPSTKIIGIGHRARQGKDTLASYLLEMLPGSIRMSFADDLKAFARVLGMTEKDPLLLQALGTNVFRSLDPSTWIRCLYWRIHEARPPVVIVPDMRFEDEVEFVKSLGGMTIKISRTNPDDSPFYAEDRDPNHPSEAELSSYGGWDYAFSAQSGDMKTIRFYADDIVRYLHEMA